VGRHALPRLPARAGGAALAVGLVCALGFSSLAAVSASGAPTMVQSCAAVARGATGPAVATLQRAVRATPDGDFGPMTQAAVKAWQGRHQLRQTGAVDAATWKALPADVALTACAQQARGAGVAVTCAKLVRGSLGPAVAVLQHVLKVTPDGEFGPITEAAVQAAQRKAKLRPSGVVGVATWAALGLTGSPACVAPATAPAPTPSGTPTSSPSPKPTPAPTGDSAAQAVIRAQVVKLAAALLDAPGTTDDPVARKALAFAVAQKGKPYRWAAAGPSSYDCSGLVMASYLATGLTLPRVAADQYGAGTMVGLDQARQGDLLFYASDVTRPATIYHVVMYAGEGKVLDAPHTGATVGTRALWTTDLLPVAVRPAAKLRLPLRTGASGWSVAQLQQELDRHGAGLAVDGGFGPLTAAAVRRWKTTHGLAGRAYVGYRAWLTLGSPPH
jgi:peptidoglycan hydrolase-like protein with peptidoglycan-binding domain